MSVQSEIDRIARNLANTYSVLEGAGAEMPQTRNSNNLPNTAASIKAVLYDEQNLTEVQKAQARENIGAAAIGEGGGGSTDGIEKLNAIASISVEYGRYEGASYYLARIPRYTIDGRRIKPKVAITSEDGSVDGAKVSALTFAKRENAIFTINGGLFNTSTKQPQGQTIIDGVSVTNTPMTDDMGTAISDDECYPLCINTDGDLSAPYERNVDTADMLADRIIYAVTAWGQFIENYAKSNSSKYNEIVHPGKYVRQVIGQYQNGDYFVCTVDGIKGVITENEAGMTYDVLADLLISKGAKFAYSLDGGGSAETVIGNRQINPIFEGNEGRKVPTVLYFTTDEYPDVDFPVNTKILYKLPQATTFDGTNYIDTGVKLYDTAKDFSIVIDLLTSAQTENDRIVFSCLGTDNNSGLKLGWYGTYQKYSIKPGTNTYDSAVTFIPSDTRIKMVITVVGGMLTRVAYCQEGGQIVNADVAPVEGFTTINRTLLIGAGHYYGTVGTRNWVGTVDDFKVYNYALSDDEITAYLS